MYGDADVFETAYERVRERSERSLYSDRDLHFVVLALTQRARLSDELRASIITLLGQTGSPESVPFLIEWVRTDSYEIRLAALQALGWIGDPEAVTAIRRLDIAKADEHTVFMRDYALKAITVKERLRGLPRARNPRPDAWYEIVSETLLEEPNWLVRADIARLLEDWNDRRVWNLVLDMHSIWSGSEPNDSHVRRVLVKRYRYDSRGFLSALRTRDSAAKVFGLDAIADFASPDDLPDFIEIAETDSDPFVREHAARVLGNLLNR